MDYRTKQLRAISPCDHNVRGHLVVLDYDNGRGVDHVIAVVRSHRGNMIVMDSEASFVPNNTTLYNSVDLQQRGNNMCGYYSIAFISFYNHHYQSLDDRQIIDLFTSSLVGRSIEEIKNILTRYINY
ncbi:hypothetical protein KIPB_004509 [Kipferlia bialata]|uniref:Uncharacterized protein n=1 Tax=Kipferlia bialata TaxID=797122 RepID=A0A391NQX2_9EUKA|nr:hypothetical protein KIPB_004509 [Kipferlia bialata]|eukprot:g4509.t1